MLGLQAILSSAWSLCFRGSRKLQDSDSKAVLDEALGTDIFQQGSEVS